MVSSVRQARRDLQAEHKETEPPEEEAEEPDKDEDGVS